MRQIPLSDIDIGDGEIDNVVNVLKSEWLSMGPVSRQFERKFSDYLQIKHAFGVSNGTAALHIANKVLGIGMGDEVILPSLTFVATANASLYCGAKPVFADVVSLDNLNISPDDILEKITPKTKAITVVHYAGYPCDMDPITEIAEDHKLKVIEDAAHAPGAEYKAKKCGTMGDIGCFSFFANKNMVTGEGGMVVTSDESLARKVKMIRSHSMTTLTWERHMGHAFNYDVTGMGFNYRINEIASAIGLAQLEKLDKNNRIRKKIVEHYKVGLKELSHISVPFSNYEGKSAYHIFPVILNNNVSRNDFMAKLRVKGIQTSIHYPPVHLFTYYRKLGYRGNTLPKTEYLGDHLVTLPLHMKIGEDDVHYIIKEIDGVI